MGIMSNAMSWPPLKAIDITAVKPGMKIWGFEQDGGHARKGWLLDDEPFVVGERSLEDFGDFWRIHGVEGNRLTPKRPHGRVLVSEG